MFCFFFFFLFGIMAGLVSCSPTRLLVFLCFCVFVCFAVPPQLVDQKLWFVNETVLNVDFELAVFQMEFDQDLYLSGETFLCGEAEKICPEHLIVFLVIGLPNRFFFFFFLVRSCWFRETEKQANSFLFGKKRSLFFCFFFLIFFCFLFLFDTKHSQHPDVIMWNVVVRLKLEEMLLIK